METGLDGSSGFLAAVHARVIHGFLLDRLAAGANQKLIILELRPRLGRFGYQVIHRLAPRCQWMAAPSQASGESTPPVSTPFLYVMAGDAAAVARWQAHPWLDQLVTRGLLDFAHLDEDETRSPDDQPIALEHAGIELSAKSPAESLVVIANHTFSSDEQDLFCIERGRLYRCMPSTPSGSQTFQLHAVAGQAAYEDRAWNQILSGYADRLRETTLSIAPPALRWLQRIREISRHGMLLCSDRGYVHEDSLDRRQLPITGSARSSGDLNFNAMGELALRTGGMVLAPAQPCTHSTTVAFLFGEKLAPPRETMRAYYDATAELFGPDDWQTIEPLLDAALPHASVEQLCAYVRLSGWDDRALARCMPHLLARTQANEISPSARLSLRHTIDEAWASHLPDRGPAPDGDPPDRDTASSDTGNQPNSGPHDEAPDMAFAMGMLLFGLAYYERAKAFFAHSLGLRGENAAAHYNLALCAAQLGQRDSALDSLDAALALEPGFIAARDMRLRVMGGM